MKARTEVRNGKPSAGSPHVWFDEGKVASENPRRGFPRYNATKWIGTVLMCGWTLGALAATDTVCKNWVKWVRPDGDDTKSGDSYEEAWQTFRLDSNAGGFMPTNWGDAADDTYKIYVCPGTYAANYFPTTSSFEIIGVAGASAEPAARGEVVIDGGGTTSALRMSSYYSLDCQTNILKISNITFKDCRCKDRFGGAIRAERADDVVVSNCVFTGGYANWGSAAAVANRSLFVDCVFEDNFTAGGGGVVAASVNSDLRFATGDNVFRRCVFRRNLLQKDGSNPGEYYACQPGGAVTAGKPSGTTNGLVIEDCAFESNTNVCGTGACLSGPVKLAKNSSFTDNVGKDGEGRACSVWYTEFTGEKGANVTNAFVNCGFTNNCGIVGSSTTDWQYMVGAALVWKGVNGVHLSIDRCSFVGNSSDAGFSVAANHPAKDPSLLSFQMADCEVISNICGEISAGVEAMGGSMRCRVKDDAPEDAPNFVRDCVFRGNCGKGPQMGLVVRGATVERSIFVDNVAEARPTYGKISSTFVFRDEKRGNVTNFVRNCLVANNLNKNGLSGAGMYVASAMIEYCTVVSNLCTWGEASSSSEQAVGIDGSGTVRNTIAFGNGYIDADNPNINPRNNFLNLRNTFDEATYYSLIAPPKGDSFRFNYLAQNHNLSMDADPRFVDPANGDWTLQRKSPCRGTGEISESGWERESTDLASRPRARGDMVSMGCYEFWAVPGLMLIIR